MNNYLVIIISIFGLILMSLFIYFPISTKVNDSASISHLIPNQNVEFSGEIVKLIPKGSYSLITLDSNISFRTSIQMPKDSLNKFIKVYGIIKEYDQSKYIQSLKIQFF